MELNYAPMRDLRGYMKPNEVERVISSGGTERNRLIMEVLWVTGARVSEVVDRRWGMRPEDLVPEENTIILRTLKRKRKKSEDAPPVLPPERRVVIPAWLMMKLVKFCENTPPKSRIFPISRQRVFQIVRDAGERAGVRVVGRKRIHPHHFRHSHCVAYIRANNTLEGLRKLQQRLLHASITTTAHYLQFAMGAEQKKIEEIFKPIPDTP